MTELFKEFNKLKDWSDAQSYFAGLMQKLQLDDTQVGGSLVIYHQGECVVNTAYGIATQISEESIGQYLPWSADTLSLNFSTGKGVLATLVHCIVSQGLLDYDKPIADYWADFGTNGKENITLRQVMSHEANLFSIASIIDDNECMLDYDIMLKKVVNMSPSLPAGIGNLPADSLITNSIPAYSALVYGWVLGGLIEQVTEMSLQRALEKYLTEPLGIADSVFFGVPDHHLSNVAQPLRRFGLDQRSKAHSNDKGEENKQNTRQRSRRKPVIKADSDNTLTTYADLPSYSTWNELWRRNKSEADKSTLSNDYLNTADINSLYFDIARLNKTNYKSALIANAKQDFDYYTPECLQVPIPAVNCVASANALGKIYAMLANQGKYQDKQLISVETFSKLSRIQNNRFDGVMPATLSWRLGYHKVFSLCHSVDDGFGHVGYNGSVAWCDPSRNLAMVFVHNYDISMLHDVRQLALTETTLSVADYLVENNKLGNALSYKC